MLFWLIISFMIFAGICLILPSFRKNRSLTVSILILFSLISVILYLIPGRYTAWREHQLVQEKLEAVRSDIRQFGHPKNLIHQLESKVQNDPDDAKAWYFLGKLYLGTGQLTEADQAFKKAKQLAPGETEIEFFSVQTAFFIHQTLNQKEKDFLLTLLKQLPNHPAALNLLALNAYNQGDYKLAIQYWKNILKHLPTDAVEERKNIQKKIDQAKKKQG